MFPKDHLDQWFKGQGLWAGLMFMKVIGSLGHGKYAIDYLILINCGNTSI
jgi:hypothetical protein